MLQAIVKKGRVFPEEVPAPLVSHGAMFIKVVNSCISAGTEVSSVETSKKSLIRRALKQPQNVKNALNMARSDGISSALNRIKGKLNMGKPTGYSLSGIVIALGEGVTIYTSVIVKNLAGPGWAKNLQTCFSPLQIENKRDVL
ncbi:hypothetical protein QUF75_01060 [Desulfococcaceae bacterium HSG7]|nr:hypothetical protein [Desulfococcaceae bacterium HSG7]